MRRRTIGALWREGVAAGHPEPAYLTRRDGTWQPVSWAEAAERVDLLAHGLLARGVRKGDSFGIVARTTLEWALADFALALVGAVTAPVYPTSSPKDTAYVLRHSGAVGALLEDTDQRAKVDAERDSLPALRDALVLGFGDLDTLADEGRAHRAAHPTAVDEAEAAGAKRHLIDWALAVGREAGALDRDGRRWPRSLTLRHRVADRLVHSKVRARLGGRLRLPISGAAPLGREIAELFDAVGIRIMEGYGLSECTSAATANTPAAYRYGTVGLALPGFELQLADDGELLIRSATVFDGYHNDPEATAEVMGSDGWLKTGDIATIDADGYVTITDRKKDIIVTAGGKNVSPQNLENELKASRWISQAIVVGDRRPYIVALLTLDAVEIGKWAADHGLEGEIAALSQDPGARALLQEVVDAVNADRTRFEQVKRFAILPRDLELGRGELTPTLKVRRKACLETFADVVEALYADV